MFFPYKDDNPRILVPYVTYAILATNVLIFGYQMLLPDLLAQQSFTLRFGLIPAYFWGADAQTVLDFNRDIMGQAYLDISWSSLGDLYLLPG
ncbi:MAG: hypothetical protein IIB42_03000, partial [Candidatus Marinimicrobia bacterium]|nr:hypothetical protein [Candidatus Neomarinimicrobiota bacterium]